MDEGDARYPTQGIFGELSQKKDNLAGAINIAGWLPTLNFWLDAKYLEMSSLELI